MDIMGVSSSIFEFSGEKFDAVILATPIYFARDYIKQILDAGLIVNCIIIPSAALVTNGEQIDLFKNLSVLRAVSDAVSVWDRNGNISIIYRDKWYLGALLPKKLLGCRNTITKIFNSDIKIIENHLAFSTLLWRRNILVSSLYYPALIFRSSIDFLVSNIHARKIIDLIIDEGLSAARLNQINITLRHSDVYHFAGILKSIVSPVIYFWNRGLPSEVDFFNGAISKLSEKRGKHAMMNDAITLIIKGLEAKIGDFQKGRRAFENE